MSIEITFDQGLALQEAFNTFTDAVEEYLMETDADADSDAIHETNEDLTNILGALLLPLQEQAQQEKAQQDRQTLTEAFASFFNYGPVTETFDCAGCANCEGYTDEATQAPAEQADLPESKDLSNEEYREYIYPYGPCFTIHEPLELYINEHGNHVVKAMDGNGYYITPGWIAIHWQVYPGADTVAFV